MGYWTISLAGRNFSLAPVDAIGQTALFTGFMVSVFLVIAFRFLQVRELFGGSDATTSGKRTNCPSCGARIAADADTCTYCGEPMER